MRPTWCGRTPRTRRSSTTLRNRHERHLCRLPTPARGALATVRSSLSQAGRRLVVPDSCGRLSPVAGRPPIGSSNGGQPVCQCAQLLARADVRQRRRGREDAHGQALRTEPGAMDGQSADSPTQGGTAAWPADVQRRLRRDRPRLSGFGPPTTRNHTAASPCWPVMLGFLIRNIMHSLPASQLVLRSLSLM
jgi:hypothetical protein